MTAAKTLLEEVWESILERQNAPAFWIREDGAYQPLTYTHFGNMIVRMTAFLDEQPLSRGDRIAVLSRNRFEWPVIDMALQSRELVLVPLYTNLHPDTVRSILEHSGAAAVIFENDTFYGSYHSVVPESCRIWTIDRINAEIPHFQWLRHAQATVDMRLAYLETIADIEDKALISISYTSGTTGDAKGVCLSHRNIVSDIHAALEILPIYASDRFLSFLPLSHMFERTAGCYVPLVQGAQIAYAEDVTTVVEDAKDSQPTIILTVPRFLEKVYEKLSSGIAGASGIQRLMLLAAGRHAELLHRKNLSGHRFHQMLNKLFRRFVYDTIRAKISSRLRLFISGGAPLAADIARFFARFDLEILEGYGLTETSPILTLNPPGKSKPGSAGIPISCIEMKIADDGEIMVRGDNVMSGYYRADHLTREVIDEDGWFHTGDVGHLDEEGALYITDRKKDLIVTAGGKNVAPGPIENALSLSPLIDQVLVTGDRRKYLSALIVPAWEDVALRIPGTSASEENCENEAVRRLIEEEIADRIKGFSDYERIRKFTLLARAFSVEEGELTATLKLKRRVVEKKYLTCIDKMY